MSSIVPFQESREGAAIERLIANRRKYIKQQQDKLPAAGEDERMRIEKNLKYAQSDLQDLLIVKRRLDLLNDITMNCIAEDVTARIMAVRKHPMADRFVGVIVYYELRPVYEWEPTANAVACVSNVQGWPFDKRYSPLYECEGMTDLGDGQFIVNGTNRDGGGPWVLNGRYVPVTVDLEDGKEVTA